MDILGVLWDIGLNKNEAKVYLALLRVEDSMAGSLAHKIGLHRACVYDALDSLESKGLVSVMILDGKKHFKARPAEGLIDFIKSKEIQVENILPEIKRISSFKEQKNNVYLSEGIFALKEAMIDLLSEGEEILMYGSPEKNEKVSLFMDNFNRKREEFKIPARFICTKDKEYVEKLGKFKKTEVKYSNLLDNVRISVVISNNKTILVSWQDLILVNVIENEQIARFHKMNFEVLWKNAKVL